MIAQDLNAFGQSGHIDGAQRGTDQLVLNEVLFDVLRVVLSVVEGQRARDEWRVEKRDAGGGSAHGLEERDIDHFSQGGC